ncbi:hypothetical protein HHL19_16350 [Streptomyces sp. R302]|uniref:hypothetical protein n=1 Tax=unclassified Streptomyces TaxID=2593676 RepID=UPI00145F81EF|nr:MULTISPECIES: hypothetical protein [unclassified Streptomyces]NML55342.1 hypothetical protein [Streptomyces sp. R301]NML80214.1 hypothetical protein [Streptomyces sp. R302]
MNSTTAGIRFAAAYAVLTAAHEVGDYWAQRDEDAVAKGRPGREGRAACIRHVASYTAVQALALAAADKGLALGLTWRRAAAGLAVSALTHYAADRCAGHWAETGPDAPALVRAAHGTGHTGWLTRAPEAGPLMDQSWHKGWIAVAAMIVAGRRS